MTWRSHRWAYPTENEHPSHDHILSLLSDGPERRFFRGRRLQLRSRLTNSNIGPPISPRSDLFAGVAMASGMGQGEPVRFNRD